MTVIRDKDRATIRDLLSRELDAPVELLLFTRPRSRLFVPGRRDCQTCAETRELLEELTGLAPNLTLTVHDVAADPATATRYDVRDVPTVVVRRASVPDVGESSDAAEGAGVADAALSGDGVSAADTVSAGDGDVPATAEAPANLRFVGLPAGYEFSTLVADV